MNWLDKYHDDWRTTDYPLDIGLDESNSYVDLLQQGFVERSPLITTDKSGSVPTTSEVKIFSKFVLVVGGFYSHQRSLFTFWGKELLQYFHNSLCYFQPCSKIVWKIEFCKFWSTIPLNRSSNPHLWIRENKKSFWTLSTRSKQIKNKFIYYVLHLIVSQNKFWNSFNHFIIT